MRTMSQTKKLVPCPELQASRLSRLFFGWSKGLEKKVEKESLTEDDLWDINPANKCRNVYPAFEEILGKSQSSHLYHRQVVSSTTSVTKLSGGSISKSSIRQRRKDKSNDQDKIAVESHSNGYAVPSTAVPSKGHNKHSSLWFIIYKTFFKEFLQTQFLRFLQFSTIWIANPHFMSYLMDYSADPDSSVWTGVLLSLTLLLLLMTGDICSEHSTWINQNLQMHIRSSLMISVYKKAINLHSKARKNYSIGEITNYLSSDCDTVTYHLTHINYVMFTSVSFIVVFYQLFKILGPAAWFGLMVIVMIMPINVYVTVKMRSLYEEISKRKDEKMKLLNEVFTGIRVLKLYAWEKCFGDKIDEARNKELDLVQRVMTLRIFTVFSWMISPYLISVVMFCGYFYLFEDSILTAKSAFAIVSLMNVLRFAINLTPEVIFDIIKASVSIKRLNKFLYEDEFSAVIGRNTGNNGAALEMKNVSFAWDKDSARTLRGINLRIAKGDLVAIVGQVGSGKSSLVSAVLGQIEKVEGHLDVQGNTAYISQQAWIQNDTVQNNILFGRTLDKHVYKKIVKACALEADLNLMTAGDQTEIGERGINLSGGQKQRVSLARAVYNDADIYLLDDPLSAVDSHVGKHIFDNVIGEKGLLRKKTRVLVTHNVRYLPEVGNIIVVDDGRVVETGTFRELLNSDGVFTRILRSYLAEYEDNRECFQGVSELESMDSGLDEEVRSKLKRIERFEGSDNKTYRRQLSNPKPSVVSRQSFRHSPSENLNSDSGKCIEEEDRKQMSGKEKRGLFLHYAKAFGQGHMITICTVYILYYFLWVGANIWMVKWTEDLVFKNISDDSVHNVTIKDEIWRTNMMYLSVYSGMGLAMTFCVLMYLVQMNLGLVKASKDLHHNMLMSILKSPMEFFDTTPVGRITSRFSKDMQVVDADLPFCLDLWFDGAMNIFVIVLAVVYSTPSVVALLIPLGYYYLHIQKYHTKIGNVLSELESKARSPIESHFTESVAGSETIRAYRAQSRFLVKLEEKMDNYHRMLFYLLLNQRWLGIHVAGVSNLMCAASSLIRSIFKGAQSTALLGLGTMFSMEFGGSMGWQMIVQSEVEINVMSVDRIMKYIHSPNEAEWRKNQSMLPSNWPDQGKLEFRNYSLRYRQGLDLVLRNISFTVTGGEKVGVVGRTGAGKSSLMLSLFRLVEPAEGTVIIDGVNIAGIGLHDLREKLAIIPQDPVLFMGTLRMNLDPQDLYTDQDIWTALDHTHLRMFVESLPDGLQSECGEGGNNFSVGQRQLFCLARTLLRKAKVLILDEATAAVDMETDDLIQQTIRSEFKDCTVLTIAHRLNTVMDYDRILVLDHGEVIELDSPDCLLHKNSVFQQMAVDAGLQTSGNGFNGKLH